MKKDFITITPDSGNGDTTIIAAAAENTGGERSSTITVSGGGMTRTIIAKQSKGLFKATKTGVISFSNESSDNISSRLYLHLISDKNEELVLLSRLSTLNAYQGDDEQISGEAEWRSSENFVTNKIELIISSGKSETINIQLNGETIVDGTFSSQQSLRFSTITIHPGDILNISGEVQYK